MVKDTKRPCCKCRRSLPLDAEHFPRHRTQPAGLDYTCRVCRCKRRREDYARDPDDQRDKMRQHGIIRRQDAAYRQRDAAAAKARADAAARAWTKLDDASRLIILNDIYRRGITGKAYMHVDRRDGLPRSVRVSDTRLPHGSMSWAGVVWAITYHRMQPHGYAVHHINKNPLDNDSCNLALLPAGQHKRLHTGHLILIGVSSIGDALLEDA
jgi:hypothetical protein